MFRLKTRFLEWKKYFQIRKNIFSEEKNFLDQRDEFKSRHEIFIIETTSLDSKQDIYNRNTIFRLEISYLDQKEDFQIEIKILRFETKVSDQKNDIQIRKKFLDQRDEFQSDFHIRNKIVRFKIRQLHQSFCYKSWTGNKIFRLQRRSLDLKQNFQIREKSLSGET